MTELDEDTELVPAKGSPVTDAERERIAGLLELGKSRAVIRRLTGRSAGTIDKVARERGLYGMSDAGQSPLARTRNAHAARSAYAAEARADLANVALQRAMEIVADDLGATSTAVFNFGGKDNEFNEAVVNGVPSKDKALLSKAAKDLMDTVLKVLDHDTRSDQGGSAVDLFLDWIKGEDAEPCPTCGGSGVAGPEPDA